jgi:outer membrane autotransporter protein
MLNSLSAQSFGDLAAVRYLNTQAFLDPMDQGCARDSGDESCSWIRLADGQTDRGNTSDASGYSAHQHLLQIGGMLELSHDLTLNGSIGYGWEDLNVSGGTAGIDGGSTTAAVGLAYRPGPLELGADLALGYAGYNSERTITVGTATGEAQAHPELWNADLRLSAAYDIPLSSRWTLKPFAHLDLAEVRTGGFDEEGSTDFNLIIDGQSHGALSGQTGLELAADLNFENGLIVRPLLSAGVEGLDAGNWGPTARFAAAPGVPGSHPLVTLPDALGDFAAGLQVSRGRTWNIQVRYDLQAGDSYRSQSGGALFTMKF